MYIIIIPFPLLTGLSKPKTPLSSSAHTMDLLGLSKTTNPMNEISFLNSGLSNGSLHGSLNSASLHASLNNASLHGSMNSMNNASLHSSMNNGSLHGSLNSASLRASLTRSHLT